MLAPDIGQVYPKSGLDADIRFDTTPRFVSTGSMFLDGTNDYLDLDGLTVTTSSANYSFSFWFKSEDGTSDHRFFGIKNNTTNDRLNLYMNATTIYSYSLSSAGGTTTTFSTSFVADFEDGTWHHAALVVTSGTGVVLYLDGQLVTASQTMRNVDLSANGLFAVGADFDGSASGTVSANICHFGVWHDALTQAEVRALMSATTYAEATSKGGSTPRAYYLLEDNANDSVGTQNGTLTNGAAIVGDRARLPNGFDLTGNRIDARPFSGRAIDLDGAGFDYISLAHPDLDGFFNTGGTISMWINMTSTAAFERLFDFGTGTYVYLQGSFSGYIFNKDFSTTDGNWTYNGNGGVALGEWFHFCLSYNAASTSNDPALYINGVLQTIDGETTPVGSAAAETSEKRIGADSSGTSPLDASLADIKLFTSTVTAAQALEMYQNPEQVLPTGIASSALKCWLPCTDFDIPTADNSLNGLYAQDASGNGNHGALTNCGMIFSQPSPCPQLGLRSSSSRCLFNDSNTVMRLSPSGTDIDCSGAFTCLFWVKTFTANGDARLLDANSGSGLVIFIDTADAGYVRLRTKISFGGTYHTWDTPNNVVPIGEWVHLGITFAGGDTNEVVYYVNGSSVTVTNPPGTPSGTQGADSGIKDIGGTGASQVWDGLISEVAIFAGTQLSANAVAVAYNSGVQGFDLLSDSGDYSASGLDGWWKIDNPVSVADLKGSTNGTWNNAPNMATIPEGSTEGLSALGSLTTPRLGPGAFCIPPQKSVAGKLGGVLTASQLSFGTQNWTIGCWVKSSGYTDDYQAVWQFKPGNDKGPRCYITAATTIQFDYKGATTDDTITLTVSSLMGNWTFVVLQRLAAASFKGWARKISDSSWTTQTESVDVGDMTDSDKGVCGWGFRSDNDAYNLNGPLAFPRVWMHGSDTPWVEAELNALFEQGKRFLIGDS